MITCPNCKTELANETKFCTTCGAPIKKNPKKIPMKIWAIGAGAVVALIVVVVIIAAILGAGSKDKYTVYLKDGELQLNLLNGKDSIEITSKFVGSMDEDYATAVAGYAHYLVKLSKDGKTIFYPDKFDGSSYTFDLYYRSATNAKAEEKKIASDVYSYALSKDGKFVIYANHKGLYEYNFKDDEKIDGDIEAYWISEDCKSIVYTTNDGDVYRWEHGKESKKLESSVNVQYVSQDLSTIIFLEDSTLYVKKGTEDKIQIDDNVSEVVQSYENGGIYYTKISTTMTTMGDYILDDYADSDAAMVEPKYPSYYDYEWPEKPTYPYSWNYDTDEEYQQALVEYDLALAQYQVEYNTVYAQYEADTQNYQMLLEEWYAKEARDYYREYFDSYEFVTTNIELYYYDGDKTKEVVKNMDNDMFISGEYMISDSEDEPVILFHVAETDEVAKIRIEDIESFASVRNQIRESLEASVSFAVASKDEYRVLVDGSMTGYTISADAKNVYYITDIDESNEGTLYEVSVAGKLGEAVKYETGVAALSLYTLESGKVIYYKDFDWDDYSGTLYIGKEKIEEDVSGAVSETADGEALYFMKDVDDGEGTLCYYKNGKIKEIGEDVYVSSIALTADGGVLYLVDYSISKEEGDLFYSDNGKEGKEIDDDVAAIVAPFAW
ncbi:MAG: zinc ribbon domain-containing protein [Agathobacter sp.]|nr:zinc ribbon domain-containing protein [Agathobacter sp.]